MTKKTAFGTIGCVAAMMLAALLPSCNSDSNLSSEYNTVSYSNTAITAFSLASNSKVLNNLDSVFFSIDLTNAQIFNARPLPYLTKIDKLVVNITTDNCSVVELSFQTKEGTDTTINYLDNSTDSINFSAGPVVLHVVSYDSQESRDYLVTVNVYDENPDSLKWNLQSSDMPQGLSDIVTSKTVLTADSYYMLANDGSNYKLTSTTALYDYSSWSAPETVSFGFTPVVESLTGTDNGTLYIISSDNMLYSSTDGGKSWSSTGTAMDYIYGHYQDTVLGSLTNGSTVTTIQYPGGKSAIQPADFPAYGTGTLLTNSTAWQISPLAIMSGGVTADGTCTGDTWGFDGSIWAKISTGTQPAMKGSTSFQYTLVETDTTTWRVSNLPVTVNMGGLLADGTPNDTVYYSTDMGVHWVKAPDYMQLYSSMPKLWGQQSFVQDQVIMPASRAVTPITQWLCPYIFLLGGYTADSTPNTSIWDGVIVRYTYVPLE